MNKQASTLRVTQDPSAFATLNREFTWDLVWTVSEDLPPGTRFQFRCRSLRTFVEWTFRGIDLAGVAGIEIRVHAKPDASGIVAYLHRHGLSLGDGRLLAGLSAGREIGICLRAVPSYFAGLDESLSVWTSPLTAEGEEPDWTPVRDATAALTVGPGPVERLGVYSHPTPDANGRVRTVLSPEDRFGNRATFAKAVELNLKWNADAWCETIHRETVIELPAPQGIGRLRVSVEPERLALDENLANARMEAGRLLLTGSPVWRDSPTGKVAGFGDIHWHSELSSDGEGSIAKGMELARDQLNLSFCAVTDHWPQGEKWTQSVETTDQFNRPDHFATLFGYEASVHHGHDNFYFLDADHPLGPDHAESICSLPPSAYRERLTSEQTGLPFERRILAVPHHTNTESESYREDGTPYWPAYEFGPENGSHRLIEIFQTRGNMERNQYTDAWRGWYAQGSSVQDALAVGYQAGFTGGTDNHCGRPGFCFAWAEMNRGRIPVHSRSLTGAWLDRVDRPALWDALYQRRTWAVWDTRAVVYFEVNGVESGGELSLRPGSSLHVRAKISADDSLQVLEIVADARVLVATSVQALDCDLSWELPGPERSGYLYLRGLQRDGGMFYASPVFLTIQGDE